MKSILLVYGSGGHNEQMQRLYSELQVSIKKHDYKKQTHADPEVYQCSQARSSWYEDSRKVNPGDQTLLSNQTPGGFRNGTGKKLPR